METEETVETMEGVLGEWTVGGRASERSSLTWGWFISRCRNPLTDGDDAETDTDTIAVGVKEGDEEEEGIIDGDSLEGHSSIVLSRLGS